jgi:hypothetical protein
MEDEVIANVSIILLCAAMKLLKKRKVKRKCWTRPWIKQRNVFGAHRPFIFIQSKLSIWGLHICISAIINTCVT